MKRLFFLLAVIAAVVAVAGCSVMGKTATQQIHEQTNDPPTIALATYYDALGAYVDAQEIYMPYQETIEKNDPELGKKIKGYFQDAWKILKAWRPGAAASSDERDSLRASLRKISFEIAKYIDNGGA